jgi:Mn-containing catalase
LRKMSQRLKSDPASDPVTGVDLGAGPGAGRTTNGDRGGSPSIHAAPAMANAIEPAE